jgi:hypothetical protein
MDKNTRTLIVYSRHCSGVYLLFEAVFAMVVDGSFAAGFGEGIRGGGCPGGGGGGSASNAVEFLESNNIYQ